MKKVWIAVLTVMLAAAISMSAAAQTELVIFAAASMTETLNEIKDLYEQENPDITLTFNFDSSGTLKTQIEEGADCDVFISAGQKQMNELDISVGEEKNPDQLDFVKEDSRIDLLENKVALVVLEGNPKGICFRRISSCSRYLMGDAELGDGGIIFLKFYQKNNTQEQKTRTAPALKTGAVDAGISMVSSGLRGFLPCLAFLSFVSKVPKPIS